MLICPLCSGFVSSDHFPSSSYQVKFGFEGYAIESYWHRTWMPKRRLWNLCIYHLSCMQTCKGKMQKLQTGYIWSKSKCNHPSRQNMMSPKPVTYHIDMTCFLPDHSVSIFGRVTHHWILWRQPQDNFQTCLRWQKQHFWPKTQFFLHPNQVGFVSKLNQSMSAVSWAEKHVKQMNKNNLSVVLQKDTLPTFFIGSIITWICCFWHPCLSLSGCMFAFPYVCHERSANHEPSCVKEEL